MKKTLLYFILAILLAVGVHPAVANSETFFTGGGIIKEGQGKDANKITFGVNIFTNELGVPSAGRLQINFHNTHYDYLGNDYFDKGKFVTTQITGGVIETHLLEYPADSGVHYDYTFVRIEAIGQFNGENDWSTVTRFSDFGEPGTGILADAVRIQLYDPSGKLVYDTGSGPMPAGETMMVYDYPHEQSWRTILDGGNVTIHYQD